MASKETLTRGGDLASLVDHTLLSPTSTHEDIEKLCAEAILFKFCSVCVLPFYVTLAKKLLSESDVKVCTVIGFPLGAHRSQVKIKEAELAIEDGATELDMVLNLAAFKSKNFSDVKNDILTISDMKGSSSLKVILETSLLSSDEIIHACQISVESGADFVKTSTGFSTGGATTAIVQLMRETVGPDVGVKASGGIRDFETLESMVNAGANRIGCSSGVKIFNGKRGEGY